MPSFMDITKDKAARDVPHDAEDSAISESKGRGTLALASEIPGFVHVVDWRGESVGRPGVCAPRLGGKEPIASRPNASAGTVI